MKKFMDLGKVVITPGANDVIEYDDVVASLRRHCTGDFGDICDEDRELNQRAFENDDDRVLSSYSSNGEKFWIITEWDRSVTTILLPEEY